MKIKNIVWILIFVIAVSLTVSLSGVFKGSDTTLKGNNVYVPPREIVIFGSRTATTTVPYFPFVISEMALNTSTLSSATSTVISGIEAYDTLDLNLSIKPSSTESTFKLTIYQSQDGGYWYNYNTSTIASIKDATTTLTYSPANTATRTISLKLTDLNTKFLKFVITRGGYEGGFVYADAFLQNVK